MRMLKSMIILPLSVGIVFGYLKELLSVGGAESAVQVSQTLQDDQKKEKTVSLEGFKAMVAQATQDLTRSAGAGETSELSVTVQKTTQGNQPDRADNRDRSAKEDSAAEMKPPSGAPKSATPDKTHSRGEPEPTNAEAQPTARDLVGEAWGHGPNLVGLITPSGTAGNTSNPPFSAAADADRPAWSIEVNARDDQLQRAEDLRLAIVRLRPKPLMIIPIRRNDVTLGDEMPWDRFVADEPRFLAGQYIDLPRKWILRWEPELERRGGEWQMVLLVGSDTYSLLRQQVDRELARRGLRLDGTALIASTLTVDGQVLHRIDRIIPKPSQMEDHHESPQQRSD